MPSITRRAAMKASAAGVCVLTTLAVPGCGMTAAQVITIVQTDLTAAENVWAALSAVLPSIPASSALFASVAGDVSQAATAITALGALVNQAASATTVSGLLSLLQAGLADAEQVLPGNAYLQAANIALAALEIAWSVVGPVTLKAKATLPPTQAQIAQANALLGKLPRPTAFSRS